MILLHTHQPLYVVVLYQNVALDIWAVKCSCRAASLTLPASRLQEDRKSALQ